MRYGSSSCVFGVLLQAAERALQSICLSPCFQPIQASYACACDQPMLSLQPMRPPWEELEPASQGAVERRRQAIRNLAQFTSIACAATLALVVVDFASHLVSALPAHSSLPHAAREIRPALIATLLSCLILLTFWLLPHLQFHYLTRTSGTLLVLHVFLLPCIVLLTASHAVLSSLGFVRDAGILYAGNVLAAHALLLLTWQHAIKGGLLFGSDVPARAVTRLRLLLRFGTIGPLVAVGVTFVNVAASLFVLAALSAIHLTLIARGGYTLDILKTGNGL